MDETNSNSDLLREELLIPTSLTPIDVTTRATELQSISAAILNLYHGRLPGRKVLPLVVQNLPAPTYKTYFEQALNPPNKPSFRWTHSDRTYLFSKPRKSQSLYQRLFGLSQVGSEELYATWKLYEYGQAKIWRLLGIIEMPSHKITKDILSKHMVKTPPLQLRRHWFLNDGAHLDLSQAATHFEGKDDIHPSSR